MQISTPAQEILKLFADHPLGREILEDQEAERTAKRRALIEQLTATDSKSDAVRSERLAKQARKADDVVKVAEAALKEAQVEAVKAHSQWSMDSSRTEREKLSLIAQLRELTHPAIGEFRRVLYRLQDKSRSWLPTYTLKRNILTSRIVPLFDRGWDVQVAAIHSAIREVELIPLEVAGDPSARISEILETLTAVAETGEQRGDLNEFLARIRAWIKGFVPGQASTGALELP